MVEAGGNDLPSAVYDTLMMAVIIASLVPICYKSESALLTWVDRVTAALFVVDYLLRLATADLKYPRWGARAFGVYPFTPWALIDLLAILPSLTALNAGFRVLKVLRLLRALRVLKFVRYSKSIAVILSVVRRERAPLLTVCYMAMGYILTTALIMFSVEPESFDTFFESVYWSTTALTTVGYGDIYPVTAIGRIVSMCSSLVGIAVVALPSGIITAGYMQAVAGDPAAADPNVLNNVVIEEVLSIGKKT